jgi:two-component system sensor histidine kinase AlgZ
MNNGSHYWRRIVLGNVIASLIVVVMFSGATFRTPVVELVKAFAVAFLFSMCIAPFVGTVMPTIAPWIWRRTKFPFNWIAVCAVMVGLAMLGSALAIAILVMIGYVPAQEYGQWLNGSLRIAVALTLTVGVFMTISEMYRAQLKEASTASKLASLEARVQPHFLFNTLNSIAELVHQDPKGAERMIGQLASLLRSSLAHEATPLVSLQDELSTVRDYLAIEKVRFGDRLKYDIRVDAAANDAGSARVPRMALQTLVENSVRYAVTPRAHGATLGIRATTGSHATSITIEDDGPGFDASTLPAGHGLALVRDRLTLLSGRDGLTIESSPAGTRITLTVPHIHDVPSR